MVLGTSSGRPTKSRHLSSYLVELDREIVMIDCGEGTQFQLLHAGVSEQRISTICLTHWHGDHVLGLPGLLSTMAMNGRTRPLSVVAPTGLTQFIDHLQATPYGGTGFPIHLTELDTDAAAADISESVALGGADSRPFELACALLDHRIPSFGYRITERTTRPRFDAARANQLGISGRGFGDIQRTGSLETHAGIVRLEDVTTPRRPKSVCIFGDTRPCTTGVALARSCDLLIHEATYTSEHALLADQYGHSTAAGAARVASDADVHELLLTHFSSRYASPEPLTQEAQQIFEAAHAATELAWKDVTRS